jgi:hypothetical protein
MRCGVGEYTCAIAAHSFLPSRCWCGGIWLCARLVVSYEAASQLALGVFKRSLGVGGVYRYTMSKMGSE